MVMDTAVTTSNGARRSHDSLSRKATPYTEHVAILGLLCVNIHVLIYHVSLLTDANVLNLVDMNQLTCVNYDEHLKIGNLTDLV